MRTHWNTLRFTESEIERVEEDIARIAAREPAVQLLAQLVGFGMINAVTVIASIGDIERFPKPGKLVRYAGLDSIVKQSSDNLWTGRISKAGRADLRGAMVDVATHAAQHHPYWKQEYERLKPKGNGVAFCAMARRLLVVVWHLLTDVSADVHCDPQQVAETATTGFTLIWAAKRTSPARQARSNTRVTCWTIWVSAARSSRSPKTSRPANACLLPPSRHDLDAVIERAGPNMRGGQPIPAVWLRRDQSQVGPAHARGAAAERPQQSPRGAEKSVRWWDRARKSGHPRRRRNALATIGYPALTLGILAPSRSLFKDVFQVLPGHSLVADGSGLRLQRYWDFPFPGRTEAPPADSDHDLIQSYRLTLEEAVSLRLRADVAVGCHLSGGLDSASVLGFASRHARLPLDAFTVGFDHASYDESTVAEQTARLCGAVWHPLRISYQDYGH